VRTLGNILTPEKGGRDGYLEVGETSRVTTNTAWKPEDPSWKVIILLGGGRLYLYY